MRHLSVLLCATVFATTSGHGQTSADETVIRQRRATSNAAIARHDTAGIGAILSDDVVVVTSNSVHGIGRATNLQRFADQFRTRPDVIYERAPDEVRIFAPWGMASEQGHWTGSWSGTGPGRRGTIWRT